MTTTKHYEELPDVEDPDPDPRYEEDEDSPADLEPDIVLDESMAEFVDNLIKRVIIFIEEFCDTELRPYQREVAYRIVESLILNDAEEITALQARQSGKTEVVADTLAGCMIVLPKLAASFEILKRFAKGLWVGVFAPTDDQSEILHGRIVDRLTSEKAAQYMLDPELDERVEGRGKLIRLRSGSHARRQTANPKAKIEGKSYHIIVIDECQDADDTVIKKSIHPMLAAYAGTMIKIGTPGYVKGDFYRAIQLNKRLLTKRGRRRNHFEYDYKTVCKYNPQYAKFINKEKLRLGEDSDEFQMSYACKWLLERGQFITEERLDELMDISMPLVRSWFKSPCVVGIDPARIKDSSVITVCWVDWDYPDPFGLREHRVLNWLELHNVPWEEQYFQILEFLDNYWVSHVVVDGQGMGSAVGERLQLLLGHRCEVEVVDSGLQAQSKRWKNLQQLTDRKLLIYPGHSKARRTRVWRRFYQQMTDVIKIFKSGQMLVEAPSEAEAHDDYVDSLALACSASQIEQTETVEVAESPFFRDSVAMRYR